MLPCPLATKTQPTQKIQTKLEIRLDDGDDDEDDDDDDDDDTSYELRVVANSAKEAFCV